MMNHGTRSCYVTHHCRCAPCTTANRDYTRERSRHLARVAYGIEAPQPDRYIDASEVRRHIEWLRQHGIGLRTIAGKTGIGRTALQQLATGESQQVQPDNAAKILSVSLLATPGATQIDARQTWRYVNDLLYLGYTKAGIARAIGQKRALQIGRDKVLKHTADKIAALHHHWKDNGVTWHGTISGYADRKCRCLACCAIASEKQQQRRSNRRDAA